MPFKRLPYGGRKTGATHPERRMEAGNRALRLVLHGTMPNGRERAARRAIFLADAGDDGAIFRGTRSASPEADSAAEHKHTETVISIQWRQSGLHAIRVDGKITAGNAKQRERSTCQMSCD